METVPLKAWESFYVIVGSAAGALTGLMFVVITMIAESRERPSKHTLGAFGTPTIVHFCNVLLLSAIMSAPWPDETAGRCGLGAFGALASLYVLAALGKARRQESYAPEAEDWVWYFAMPLLCYAAIIGAAAVMGPAPKRALDILGASSLLLLFTALHNSWDTVVYIAVDRRQEAERES